MRGMEEKKIGGKRKGSQRKASIGQIIGSL